jgi:hypothetical protein
VKIEERYNGGEGVEGSVEVEMEGVVRFVEGVCGDSSDRKSKGEVLVQELGESEDEKECKKGERSIEVDEDVRMKKWEK